MIFRTFFSTFKVSLVLFLFSTFSSPVCAQETYQDLQNTTERIISFHSDIHIDSTGMMYVREKIKIYASGAEIKRGIVRTIPLFRKDIFGQKNRPDFKITGI